MLYSDTSSHFFTSSERKTYISGGLYSYILGPTIESYRRVYRCVLIEYYSFVRLLWYLHGVNNRRSSDLHGVWRSSLFVNQALRVIISGYNVRFVESTKTIGIDLPSGIGLQVTPDDLSLTPDDRFTYYYRNRTRHIIAIWSFSSRIWPCRSCILDLTYLKQYD